MTSRRAGIDRAAVVAAAASVIDAAGLDALTLTTVAARLGVRTQSLYSHVDGLEGLRRDLAIHANVALAEALRTSVMGLAGVDAIHAIARAYAAFATAHPGLYLAGLRSPAGDEELGAAMARATEPLTVVLQSYGLDAEAVIHWHRTFHSAVHGFLVMRQAGLFTLPADVDDSYRLMIDVYTEALTARAHRRG